MSVLILTLVLGADTNQPTAQKDETPRPFHVINAEIRSSLRQEATAKEPAKRAESIRALVQLHDELRKDARLATSDTLQSYRAKVWSRLTRVKRRLLLEIERDAESKSPHMDAEAYEETAYATRELAWHLALVGQTMGGPALVMNGGLAGGRAVSDYGPELVDLIERTINPAFWDTNGGPGSIYYYAPLHALVVSATSEVHERIGGVIGGLRAAGN